MKMTLSSPSNSTERQNSTSENKSLSPNSSPRSSPRPSPKPQNRREHSKSDTHLTVNYKEISSNQKQDGSPSSQEGSVNSRLTGTEGTPGPIELSKSESGSSTNKDKKEGRSKKKSWLNSFYPTYKSRSEDFKKIFKDVPDDERLVVDYSCALQKEILVHGRLYVTQHYLCFYANIFGWETNVTLKWADVSSITKEKTALVIPNAVLISTKSEKMFFTSFVSRDKVYMMLFRVWQNALMGRQMRTQEMWQWVHQSYGDELGLTSDDEDYIAPGTEDDKLSARLSIESFSEECVNPVESIIEQILVEEKHNVDIRIRNTIGSKQPSSDAQLPTDMSDTTESDGEKPINVAFRTKLLVPNPSEYIPPEPVPSSYHSDTDDPDCGLQIPHKCDITNIKCSSAHEGRQLMNEVLPIHIDQLFTLIFTSSKFYLDFHASRKTTDLIQTPWSHNPVDNSKCRVVNLTVALNQSLGPKTAQVTETQVMLPCSKAGQLYCINSETINAGVPYGDSFYIVVHCCIKKISETKSSITVFGQIKYRKTVWSIVKGMIEKNCWSGLEDFYNSMGKALHSEGDELVPDVKRKSRRKRRIHSMPRPGIEESDSLIYSSIRAKGLSFGVFSSDAATIIVFIVLLLLVILNVMLYYKLWSLEEAPPYTLLDVNVLKDPPKSHDEWIKLLQQQETLHSVEAQKWQRILKTSIELLKQTEESLNELQNSINPTYADKIISAVQSQEDNFEKVTTDEL